MEWVRDQGRTEQKAYLRSRHPGLEFGNYRGVEKVALLDGDLVRLEKARRQRYAAGHSD
jgi:hypothetical protein